MNKSNDCKEDDDRRRDGVMIVADLHLVASVYICIYLFCGATCRFDDGIRFGFKTDDVIRCNDCTIVVGGLYSSLSVHMSGVIDITNQYQDNQFD